MKTKHTQGEWIIENGEIRVRERTEAGVMLVKRIADVNPTWDHDGANAKLIAAAPELLEALNKVCDEFESYANCDNVNGQTDLQTAEHYMTMMKNAAVSAIKKATE